VNDPLHNLVQLKPLEEIIAAARDTIKRHRRRFLQRNMRPCPENCKGASMLGHKVIGCTNCGAPNADTCIKDSKFVPLFTKEELAQQFANQLRDPEVLLREYRDVTVFLWVLGAFDKQTKVLDEDIVEKVEQSGDKAQKMAANSSGGRAGSPVRANQPSSNDSPSANGTGDTTPNFNR
jgi:hypothetical protein